MTIAIMLDFSGEALSRRDGIFVYLHHLLAAMLKYEGEIYIEIWVYSHAEEEAAALFKELIDLYGTRIRICSDRMTADNRKIRYFTNCLLKRGFMVGQRLAECCKAERAGDILKHKAEIYERKVEECQHDLIRAFEMGSGADVCYVPFVTLKTALACGRPAVVQVHDLFTFQFYDLFKEQTNPPALFFKYNMRVRKILSGYAKQNAKFVSSSEYTIHNQILRYIPDIREHNCKAIAFPPLITQFDAAEIVPRKEFMNKMGIDCRYVAFPSQNRPNKNLILLLRALKLVNERGHRIKLVTTGRMKDVRATGEFCRENPGLVLETGSLSERDLYSLYKYASMVVCPNLIEGMNISGQGLEALAIGNIPVIHVKSLGIETSLKRAGLDFETADLNWVEPDDICGLAEKIIDVLHDPAKCVQKQLNVIKAYNRISWQDVVKDYMKLFKSITRRDKYEEEVL